MKVKQIFCAFIIICSCAPEPRKRADPVEIIEDGVKNLLNQIHYWKDAPVWTPKSIKKETKIWFKLLRDK